MSSTSAGPSADPDRLLRLKQRALFLSQFSYKVRIQPFPVSVWEHLITCIWLALISAMFWYYSHISLCTQKYITFLYIILYLGANGQTCLRVSMSVNCTACPPLLVLNTSPWWGLNNKNKKQDEKKKKKERGGRKCYQN